MSHDKEKHDEQIIDVEVEEITIEEENIENVINHEDYAKEYSEEKLFRKILTFAKKAGIKVIYVVLLLFYTLQKSTIPVKVKTTIIGALGYFILPVDIIPDFIPGVGYGDDFMVLLAAVAATAFYIDGESKKKAKKKLQDWFGEYDERELDEVNIKIETKQSKTREKSE